MITDAGEIDGGGPRSLAAADTMLARASIGSSILLVCRSIHFLTDASFGRSGIAGAWSPARWATTLFTWRLSQPGVEAPRCERFSLSASASASDFGYE